MRDDPFPWGATAVRADKYLQRRALPAVIHWSPDSFQKFIERPRPVAEHLHFLARLCQMCREQNLLVLRNERATLIQLSGRGEHGVRREAPLLAPFQRFNRKIDNF